MVENINPTYYAANVLNSGYILEGKGFSLIPNDAVGIYANNNDAPLQYRYSTNPDAIYRIVNRTATTLEFAADAPSETHGANYIGAIVSPTRETIYWINDSKPLP